MLTQYQGNDQTTTHSLHLVLPPATMPNSIPDVLQRNPSAPIASPVPPNPPSRPGTGSPAPQPNHGHQHLNHNPFGGQFAQGQVPAHVQSIIQTQLNAVHAQLNAQQAAGQVPFGGMPQSHGFHVPQVHGFPMHHAQGLPMPPSIIPNQPSLASFQQMIAQQQQLRAAAAMQGLPNTPTVNLNAPGQPIQQVFHGQVPAQHGAPQSNSGSTATHESLGPNGERIRVTVNTSVIQMSHPNPIPTPNGSANPVVGSRPASQRSMGSQTSIQHRSSNAQNQHAQTANPSEVNTTDGQARVDQSSRSISERNPFPQIVPDEVENLFSHPEQAGRNRESFQPAATNGDSSVDANASASATGQTQVYLLSSPSGPHALVFSSGGIYTGSRPVVPQARQRAPFIWTAAQRAEWDHDNPPERRPVPPVIERPRDIIEGVRAENRGRNANDNVLWGILRRIWLFVRLYFFSYLFSNSGTWRRYILVTLAFFAALLSETDVIRRTRAMIWEPVQRHIEGLVPLPGNEGQNQRRPETGATPGQNGEQPRPAGERDPNRMAERLLQQQAQRDTTWLQQNLRRAERAVALFLASLVPGVGERHIEARNAAEAASHAEERQREEEERRRQESTAEQSGEPSAETQQSAEGNVSEEAGVTGNQPADQAAGQNDQPQQPLVEI